jgi:F-type H+-transporting ATPase subunit a
MYDFLSVGPSLLAEASVAEPSSPARMAVRLLVYIFLLLAIIFGLMAYAKKGFTGRVFTGWVSSCFEQIYLFVEHLCLNTIGANGRKYVTLIFTYWVVIFFGNLMALFFPYSPTADLSFNLGMAVIAIGYVQYEGIRARGFFGHVGHFTGPKLTGAMVVISGMIFIIEIISELMKNLSLSLRLYGNIHGGHVAVETLNLLGSKYYVPLGELLLPIKLLTVVVQPLIFTLLTCVYISLATHHDDEDDHSHGDSPAHDAILAAQH